MVSELSSKNSYSSSSESSLSVQVTYSVADGVPPAESWARPQVDGSTFGEVMVAGASVVNGSPFGGMCKAYMSPMSIGYDNIIAQQKKKNIRLKRTEHPFITVKHCQTEANTRHRAATMMPTAGGGSSGVKIISIFIHFYIDSIDTTYIVFDNIGRYGFFFFM